MVKLDFPAVAVSFIQDFFFSFFVGTLYKNIYKILHFLKNVVVKICLF